MSRDVVADCRERIALQRKVAVGLFGASAVWLTAYLDAFSAILDMHRQDPDKGCDCDVCYMDAWPCRTVRVVAAGLGVEVEA